MSQPPPHDLKAECALIGVTLADANTDFAGIVALVAPEAFYSEAHARAWKAIVDLVKADMVPDAIQLQAQLRRNGDSGVVDGSVLETFTPTRAEFSFGRAFDYGRIVVDLARCRALLRALQESVAVGYSATMSAEEYIRDTTGRLEAATKLDAGEYEPKFVDVVCKDELARLAKHNGDEPPIAVSGLSALDEKLKILSGELIIIAGRPGLGKSSLASQYALATGNTLFCSLEMPNEQMAKRAFANATQLQFARAIAHQSRFAGQIVGGFKSMQEASVATVDKPAITVSEVRAFARHMKRALAARNGGELRSIVIDYLQLMSPEVRRKGGTREEEVASITKSLKALAKQEKVAIILLSQLSREAEKTKDGRPTLAHLRESGSIEQDADAVLFVYRPGYYDKQEAKPGETEEAEIIIAKFRNGQPGLVRVGWRGDITSFVDAESGYEDGGGYE